MFDKLSEIVEFDDVGSKQGEMPHLYQLFSLEKFYPEDGNTPNRTFDNPVETCKLDGACIAAVYVSGELVRVLTRGDGIRGRDITNKFLGGHLIPAKISTNNPTQITFEVVAPISVENSRNYASGALNLKSLDEFKTRDITCIAHSITPSPTGTFRDDMKWLHDQSFWSILDKPDWTEFPQDGKVVRENIVFKYEKWGYTNHHPRGAYALKTRREAVQTKLVGVTWQVGKSGKVTPVAQLDPVDIEGAMVSRASLHNIAFIESLELDIGDMVEVVRSGEIIPYIIGKVEQ